MHLGNRETQRPDHIDVIIHKATPPLIVLQGLEGTSYIANGFRLCL